MLLCWTLEVRQTIHQAYQIADIAVSRKHDLVMLTPAAALHLQVHR